MFKPLLRVALPEKGHGEAQSAKTLGINQALSLEYLKSQGLYSIRDGWLKLHYPK